MSRFLLRSLVVAMPVALSACSMVPGQRPVSYGRAEGLQWLYRAADGGEGEAAIWGPPRSAAVLMIQCTGAGADLVVEADDRPSAPWRLIVGRESMALDPIHHVDAIPTEVVTIPRGSPLLGALATAGGPMRLSTRVGEMVIPADPVVARVAAACGR